MNFVYFDYENFIVQMIIDLEDINKGELSTLETPNSRAGRTRAFPLSKCWLAEKGVAKDDATRLEAKFCRRRTGKHRFPFT